MSAIGFSPQSPNELDQLREAYRSLNDITRNLASAQKCLQKGKYHKEGAIAASAARHR